MSLRNNLRNMMRDKSLDKDFAIFLRTETKSFTTELLHFDKNPEARIRSLKGLSPIKEEAKIKKEVDEPAFVAPSTRLLDDTEAQQGKSSGGASPSVSEGPFLAYGWNDEVTGEGDHKIEVIKEESSGSESEDATGEEQSDSVAGGATPVEVGEIAEEEKMSKIDVGSVNEGTISEFRSDVTDDDEGGVGSGEDGIASEEGDFDIKQDGEGDIDSGGNTPFQVCSNVGDLVSNPITFPVSELDDPILDENKEF
ncbi:hypothetical protein U1Q18_045337 [Sarracenia purpurea var. burkii]